MTKKQLLEALADARDWDLIVLHRPEHHDFKDIEVHHLKFLWKGDGTPPDERTYAIRALP
jgi:hypothetical protein